MKKLILAGLTVGLVFTLGGCAGTADRAQYYAAVDQANARADGIASQYYAERRAKYDALASFATSTDPTTKVAAVMAIALGGNGGSATLAPPAIPQLPPNEALQWASIVVPPLTTLGLAYYAADTAQLGMRLNAQTQQYNTGVLGGVATDLGKAGIQGTLWGATVAPGIITDPPSFPVLP